MSCRRRPPDPSRPAQQPQGCESRPPVGDPARPAGSARPPRVQRVRGWEPPQLFATRYLWRGSPSYQALVRDSQDRLLEAGLGDEELRYAEIRALVGGVTAIQGPAAAPAAPKRPWSAILTCASSASTEPPQCSTCPPQLPRRRQAPRHRGRDRPRPGRRLLPAPGRRPGRQPALPERGRPAGPGLTGAHPGHRADPRHGADPPAARPGQRRRRQPGLVPPKQPAVVRQTTPRPTHCSWGSRSGWARTGSPRQHQPARRAEGGRAHPGPPRPSAATTAAGGDGHQHRREHRRACQPVRGAGAGPPG
jgi:hypothetical protein